MPKTPKISLFVPAYNEESTIKKDIKGIKKQLKDSKFDFEIFIVDDNSSDSTERIGKRLSSKNKNINYIRYNEGPSKRENLAKSVNRSKGNIIVLLDAGESVPFTYIPKIIEKVINGSDIVIGSKYLKESNYDRPFYRTFFSKSYNLLINLMFSTKVSDHNIGFKAFKKNKGLKIIKKMGYDKKRGWFWDAEFIIRSREKNYTIKEIPITYRHNKTDFNFLKDIWVLKQVIRYRLR